MPKPTHIVSQDGAGDPKTSNVLKGPIAVYGEKDLKQRKDAAKKAGVKLNVRKAK